MRSVILPLESYTFGRSGTAFFGVAWVNFQWIHGAEPTTVPAGGRFDSRAPAHPAEPGARRGLTLPGAPVSTQPGRGAG